MLKEVNLGGVFVSPFAVYLLIALIIFVVLRLLGDQLRIDRWIWHRHLFDVALFVIILSIIGLIF